MNVETENVPKKSSFVSKVDVLSAHINDVEPIHVTADDCTAIASELSISPDLLTEEEKSSLMNYQFRSLESGRGVGFLAVLGEEKAKEVLDWCEESGNLGIVNKETGEVRPGSKGRGLRQLAADYVALGACGDDEKSRQIIETRMNRRVWKGYSRLAQKQGQSAIVEDAFALVEKPLKPRLLASVPPGKARELWDVMVS